MTVLVVGGAASGKSEFAESLVTACPPQLRRTYIATMQPFDGECRARIAKHRAMRAQKQFDTVECYTGLQNLALPPGGAVLLECMGNLAANELYAPAGAQDERLAREAIMRGAKRLAAQSALLVIVSNEVFTGGADYAGDTGRYLRLLARLNRDLAALADEVYELCYGLPVCYKGPAARPLPAQLNTNRSVE